MGNVSIYLPDDLHEWANDNIKNLSLLAQDAVLKKKNEKLEIENAVKKNRYTSLLLYSMLFILGITSLVFSYIIHVSPLQGTISISYEVMVMLIIGLTLQFFAIWSLWHYRKTNGVKQ